ncbi:putative membrane protein [Halobacillus karajensis]|uniref:Bacterial membrane flanked domain protein n=2 Tax=Halobacillus karajensis TaxID=195088 RepID=A0A024P7Y6_9BACI|nr:PH domain-containing protein [Halobacillus karajensis]CDQ21190.1 Bacterial membrane flanked domain protein [Halobacillus karajensis]CDQ24746.1 Bacterial membrane flanked domain protein [Halobacillus karajensis]CDQ28894.1 Bacterial membrane flanked domain protein [Halobacillus karajensis]SEH95050.1 putative membrane protein [Halobacillus karajensis]
MFEPKRLHPISAIINFVKTLKDAALPLILVLVLNGNIFRGNVDWLPLLIWAGVLLLVLGSGIIRWLRFTYRMEEGELRIEYGLIFRKKRYIPIDRIQSLDFSEGIFHRPLNLVKVSVETAGSSGNEKAEAELTAIRREEADELEEAIFQEKKHKWSGYDEESDMGGEIEESPREKVYGMTMKEIIMMAITSGGAGVVISGVAVFFSQFMDLLPVGTIYNEILDWIQIGILVVAFTVLVLLLIAYAISIVMTILRYANFSVFLDADDLIITRGWLEKKQMTIPLNRIQGIKMEENLIRQPLGYASVTLISAGGSVLKNDEHQLRLLPMIKREEVSEILKKVLPDYEVVKDFHQPPKRSLVRYIFRHSWFGFAAAIPLSVFFFPYGLLSILGGVFLAVLGWMAYKDAGWNVLRDQLTLRSRGIIKQTYTMKKYRIQSSYKKQTYFQKRSGLSSIEVTLTSGNGRALAYCYYMEEKDSNHIMEWYRMKKIREKPAKV